MLDPDPHPGSDPAIKKARALDSKARTTTTLRDRPEGAPEIECPEKRKVRARARAQLNVDEAILLNKQRGTMPPPTTSTLQVGVLEVDGHYGGDATLSVVGVGRVAVYLEAGCINLVAAVLDDHTPLLIPSLVLRANTVLHLRGSLNGAMAFTLTLAPQDGFTIPTAPPVNSEVVELTLNASRRGRPGDALPDSLRIDHGHILPIPQVPLAAPRASLQLAASNDGSTLVMSAAVPARLILYNHAQNVTLDQFGVQAAGARQFWIAATAANAPLWVDAGLVLLNGTVLRNGDCVRYEPVALQAISLGFECECNSLLVQARHNEGGAEALMRKTAWLNVPSKSTVYVSTNVAVGNRMRIDVEMADPTSYGEFVLGPLYSYAHLEGACGEMRRIQDFIDQHRVTVSQTHPRIMDTNDGHFNEEWAPANSKVTLSNTNGGWGGTAQATFAVPIWMLPEMLGDLDNAYGAAAQQLAELTPYSERVYGLVAAVDYYLRCLGPLIPRITDKDGPKTCTPVMFRSDFHAMYLELPGPERLAFSAWAGAHASRALRMMPGGSAVPHCTQGPTVGDWLDSIILPGVDGKDRMSPPPGFARHNPVTQEIRYGMGMLECDDVTHHVIAEFRSLGNANNLDAFLRLAFAFAERCGLAGPLTWTNAVGGNWGPPNAGRRRQSTSRTEYSVLT